jgi:hypothetical protein
VSNVILGALKEISFALLAAELGGVGGASSSVLHAAHSRQQANEQRVSNSIEKQLCSSCR